MSSKITRAFSLVRNAYWRKMTAARGIPQNDPPEILGRSLSCTVLAITTLRWLIAHAPEIHSESGGTVQVARFQALAEEMLATLDDMQTAIIAEMEK